MLAVPFGDDRIIGVVKHGTMALSQQTVTEAIENRTFRSAKVSVVVSTLFFFCSFEAWKADSSLPLNLFRLKPDIASSRGLPGGMDAASGSVSISASASVYTGG